MSEVRLKVLELADGSYGKEIGLQPGDFIVGINGQPLTSVEHLKELIEKNLGHIIELLIIRDHRIFIKTEAKPLGVLLQPFVFAETSVPSESSPAEISEPLTIFLLYTLGLLSLFGGIYIGFSILSASESRFNPSPDPTLLLMPISLGLCGFALFIALGKCLKYLCLLANNTKKSIE